MTPMAWDEGDDGIPLNSLISERLWQGGTDDEQTTFRGSKRLAAFNDAKPFDSVVTLSAHSLPMGWLVKEFRYGFNDGPLDPITIPEIEAVATWAFAQWKSGDRVLIRCQAGMNRSSLVTALILMHDGKSADQAIELIRERRSPDILSNTHFVEYLKGREFRNS